MILALAGGVGGARLASGLARVLAPDSLAIAVNVGDDFEHLGLAISPDLDTVMYTLAGLHNPATGWGRADETWSFIDTLATLGVQPGDRVVAQVEKHVEGVGLYLGNPSQRWDVCLSGSVAHSTAARIDSSALYWSEETRTKRSKSSGSSFSVTKLPLSQISPVNRALVKRRTIASR